MTDNLSLLAELESLLRRLDPVPDPVCAAAEAAFLLACLEDSWERLEPVADPVPVRSIARSFRFQGDKIRVEVRLARLPWGVRLEGLVVPAAVFEVCWPTGSRTGRPDAAGLFRLDDLPSQPLRIQVGSRVTPWFWA